MKHKRGPSPFLVVMSIFLFFLSIYLVTPNLYEGIKTKQYDKAFETFKSELMQSDDLQTDLLEYAIENDAIVSITNQNMSTPIIKSNRVYYHQASLTHMNGQILDLKVQYTFSSLSDINALLILILPVLGLVLSIAYLIIYATSSKKEKIGQFYPITEDMLRLKPKARLPIDSDYPQTNKIAKNINELYEILLIKNDELDKKNQDYQLMLEKSKDILSSNQHYMEHTIKEILEDLKGMIQNQGRYRNPTVALMEIKVKLEDLLDHKEISKKLPTTVHEIFETVLKPYEILINQKQVSFAYSFEKNFKVQVDDLLFHQAISHLMAFIINQCDAMTQIKIIQNEYDIAFQYKGACLTKESIEQVEAMDENIKNAYRYVRQLGFFIDLSQTQQKDGMQFTFHF